MIFLYEKARVFVVLKFFKIFLKKVLTTEFIFDNILLADARETQASVFFEKLFDN